MNEALLKRYLDVKAGRDLPNYQPHWTMVVRQFNAGQSNPTYCLAFYAGTGAAGGLREEPELRVVLRKRPPRVNVASAHNVAALCAIDRLYPLRAKLSYEQPTQNLFQAARTQNLFQAARTLEQSYTLEWAIFSGHTINLLDLWLFLYR